MRTLIGFLICLVGASGISLAQESSYPSHNDSPDAADQSLENDSIIPVPVYPSYDDSQETVDQSLEDEAVIPVPVRGENVELFPETRYGDARSRGAQDFQEDVFLNSRNQFGFSLSASQGYSENISETSRQGRSSMFSAFSGQVFFNAGRRRSKLHLDFGSGYRHYYKRDNYDDPDYRANAQYSYQISRTTSLQFSNQFTYTYNDSWSFPSMYSPSQYGPIMSDEVLYAQQKIVRNAFGAGLRHRLSDRISTGLSATYALYRYSEHIRDRSDTFTLGGQFNVKLTDWLSLTNSYAAYLISESEEYRDTRIHRVQLSGLDFSWSRGSWRLWMGGGADFSDYEEKIRVMENVSAGIGRTSLNTTFTIGYQHGFSSTLGISGLRRSDRITAEFGYRATPWMNVRLNSSYIRSKDVLGPRFLEIYSSGGGLSFALSSNLNMTLNSYYQRQQPRNLDIEGLDIERVTAYMGFQFVWPARRKAG
ncbi:MAG: hypothetical protein JXR49_16230 [Acidobacteria bacterium]|nr:hypothetical protein [Acidobacteriota bacterium]